MQKTNYGSVVESYLGYKNNRDIAEWRLGHEPLLMLAGDLSKRNVLDFGCGPANFSLELTKLGAQVVGVDSDQAVIDRAKRNDPNGDYRFYKGLLADELVGEEFDLAIASFSFCLIPDRELRYILRDMRKVISPEGKLYILEPNQEKSHGVKYANLHYHLKENVQSGDYVHVTLGSGEGAIELYDDIYRTHADYRRLIEEAGFVVDRMEEPRPKLLWEGDWRMETKYPPFLLITAH